MIADGRPGLRDYIGGQLDLLSYYVASAQNFAAIGDDTGLEYCVRKLVENTGAVAAGTSDLLKENRAEKAQNKREAA